MRLSESEIESRLQDLPGWDGDDEELERAYSFADFKEAMFFVNAVAGVAEAMNHHPEIEISYNEVEIELTTHSEGGVTEKDFELAVRIEQIANALGASDVADDDDDEDEEEDEDEDQNDEVDDSDEGDDDDSTVRSAAQQT